MLSLVALFACGSVFAASSRRDAIERVDSCEAILREFQARPQTAIPAEILQRAKAIVILNQFKAGIFLGVKDGYGVVMVRRFDNSWSIPVLVRAAEASLGLQIGANAAETVLIINDANIPKQLFKGGRFNVGVDAKAVAGPHAASKERYNEQLLKAPILAYTRNVGLFAGATVKTGHIHRDDQINHALYNTRYAMPELLYGDFVPPVNEVLPLMQYVQKLAP